MNPTQATTPLASGKLRPWATHAAKPPKKPSSKPRKPPSEPEWLLQSAMVSEFHKLEAEGWRLTVAGDMGAAKRSFAEAAKCKASGLTAGEPDLRLYLPDGKTVFIECKKVGGVVSEAQKERHARLRALGFVVYVEFLNNQEHARHLARDYANTYSHCGDLS